MNTLRRQLWNQECEKVSTPYCSKLDLSFDALSRNNLQAKACNLSTLTAKTEKIAFLEANRTAPFLF